MLCCDVCCPSLLELVKPRPYTKKRKSRSNAPARSVVQSVVQNGLLKWRDEILALHHPHAIYSSAVILPDPLLDFLASIGSIPSLDSLKSSMVGEGWFWWEKHGTQLFEFLSTKITIPLFEPLPPKPKRDAGSLKRPLSTLGEEVFAGESNQTAGGSLAAGSTPNASGSTPQPSAKRLRTGDTTDSSAPNTGSHSSTSPALEGTPRPPPPATHSEIAPATPHPRPHNPYSPFWPTPLPTPRTQPSSSSKEYPNSSFKNPNATDYLRAFQAFHAQAIPPPNDAFSRNNSTSSTPKPRPKPSTEPGSLAMHACTPTSTGAAAQHGLMTPDSI